MDNISWPPNYRWLHEYALAKPDALLEYKETWDALLYRLYGKTFALLLRNRSGTLLNLKGIPPKRFAKSLWIFPMISSGRDCQKTSGTARGEKPLDTIRTIAVRMCKKEEIRR